MSNLFPRDRFGAAPPSLRPDDPGMISATRERARRDYLRSLMAELPDPEQLLWHLPHSVLAALAGAWRSRDGCLRVSDEDKRECSLWGLVEVGGPYLTSFGHEVRRAMREEGQ